MKYNSAKNTLAEGQWTGGRLPQRSEVQPTPEGKMSWCCRWKCWLWLMILCCFCAAGQVRAGNTSPTFVGGGTGSLVVNQYSGALDIKNLLHVSDTDSGQTETWSQLSAPSHGTLVISSATATSGSTDIIPGGTITYKPTGNYSGADSFTVQVSDGAATATRTISVTVDCVKVLNSSWPTFWARPGQIGTYWTNTLGNGFGWITNVLSQFNGIPMRGKFEFSIDSGSTWQTLGEFGVGANAPLGALVRYVDQNTTSTNGQTFHVGYQTAAGNTTTGTSIGPDAPPTDVALSSTAIWDTLVAGDTVATLSAVDTGLGGGTYVIASQSVPNLFVIDNTSSTLKLGSGTMPTLGGTATVTIDYYDPFQLDCNGAPIVGDSVAGNPAERTFTILVRPSVTLPKADFVIGQSNFRSNGYATNAVALASPSYSAVDATHGKLYVTDVGNNRVLRYAWPITGNQPTAEVVFGQADMVSGGYDCTATNLAGPAGIAVDAAGNLWVVDNWSSRVLRYPSAYSVTTNGAAANLVLGQSSFTTADAGTTATALAYPSSVAFDGAGNLWVVDQGNSRVLKFANAGSLSSGAAATTVLGQGGFTTADATINQAGMNYPSVAIVSGTTLLVSDYGNNRVLRFDNAASKSNGANADAVLGQTTFVSGTANTTQNGLSSPNGLATTPGGDLFVADSSNQRILVYSNFVSKVNGDNADMVIGTTSFTDINLPGPTSQSDLNSPIGLTYDAANSMLVVDDAGNNRVLVYAFTPPKSQQSALVLNSPTSQAYNGTNTLSTTGGSGTGAVTYTVLTGPGLIINDTQLVATAGSGTIDVVATKAGDASYYAISVTNSVTAISADQAPLLLTSASPQVYGTTNTLSATGGTIGGTITYSVISGPGQIVNGTQLVAMAGSGSIEVAATMAGDANYNPVSVTNTVVATLATQANLNFNPAASLAYNATNTLLVTGGSGTGAITYSVLTGPGIIVNGTQLVATAGSGAIEVVATKDTDGNYAAISATNTVNATLATQAALAFNTTTPQVYGTTNALSATGGSGTGAFSYSVLSGPGLIVNGTQLVAMAGSGTITVVATRTGDANYADASITNTVLASQRTLTVTGAVANNKPYDGNPTATVDYSAAQLVGVISPDSVSLDATSATAAFADKNAGNGKSVTVSGLALTGPNAANYTLTQPSLSANISRINLGIKANDLSRSYGDTNPVFTFTYSGFVGGDDSGSLTTLPTATTTATPTSWIGKYAIVPSGGSALNYTLSYTNGQLTVTKTPLQVSANDASRAYGSPNPTFTATITGIKNNDDITASMTTPATQSSPVTNYVINVSVVDPDGKLGAYTLSIKKGNLSVTNAVLVGQVASVSRGYGETNPAFTVDYTGFVNGENTNVLQGTLSYSCLDTNDNPVDMTTPVGTYPIEVLTGQTNANYKITYQGGTLTVTQAVLNVIANNATKVYGDSNPVFSASYSGFRNGETTNVLGGALALTTTATASTGVGNYSIVPSGFTSTNYSVVYSNGNLAITPAALSVTVSNASKVYGQANPSFGGNFSGTVNGDNITATYVSAASVSSPVGSYPIVPSFADPGSKLHNYTVVTNGGTLSISSASLTGTVLSYSRAYGETNPVFAINYTGFVNGDTTSIVTGTPVFACLDSGSNPVNTNTAVGDYPITVLTGQTAPNYSVSYVTGLLSVTQAVLVVTADNIGKVYGETNPPLSATITGFVNDENTNVLTGELALSTIATISSGVGTYPITASGYTSSNYHIDYVDGVLTVGKASLRVAADDKTRSYGDTNPTFTVHYSGFVDGDTESVITGTPSLTTTATASSGIGNYAITVSNGTLNVSNYALTFVNGTLTVQPGSLIVTADSASRAYGDVNPTFTGSLAGLTNNDDITASFTSTATAASAVGSYAITPVLSDPSNRLANYVVTTNPGSLTVTQASLTITVNNKTKMYGQGNPTLDGTVVGVANGDSLSVSYSTAASTFSPVGVYDIVPAIDDPTGKLPNYLVTTNAGNLTIGKALLTVTANDQRRTYGTTNPPLTLSYSGFVGSDSVASLTVVPVATVNADTNSWIGKYPIIPAGGVSSNYDFAYVNGTLTVGKPQLIVTVDSQERVYGAANPPLTFTMTGVANNDDLGVFVFTSATTNSAPGVYDIEVGFEDPDGLLGLYDVSAYGGFMIVDKAPLVGTVQDASRTYGTDNPSFSVSYSGFANGETASVLSGTVAYACKTPQGATVTRTTAVGAYPITVSTQQTSANYAIQYVNGTLTVGKAPLTVTANGASRVYGETNPVFSGTITGIQNADNITATYSTAASATSGVGSYAIVPSLVDPTSKLGNYDVTANNGALSVTPASLTGTVVDATRVYGETNPLFQVAYSGYLNGDTDSVVSGTLGFSCLDSNLVDVTTNTVVGVYPIHVSTPQTAANYSIHYTDGQLSITQAVLTITAVDKRRAYGQSNPELTFDVTGFANNEDTNVLSGAPVLSTTATVSSPIGSYDIVADVGTLTATNYSFVTSNGVLRVTQGTLVVTADDSGRLYGQGNPTFTGTISGLQNGDQIDATYASDATATNAVGAYAIVPTLVDPNNLATNYTVALNNGTLTISKADLSIVADSTSRLYGQTNPAFTGVITGIQNSDSITATYAAAADATSAIGNYDIVPTAVDPDNKLGNYNLSITNGVLTVNQASLIVTADNTNRVYGESNPVFTGTVTGVQNGDGITATYASAADASTSVGGYPIIPTLIDPNGKLGNYSVTTNNGTLTITAAPLTVVAADATRVYGAANPTFNGAVSGVLNNDGITATYSTVATAASPVGTYAIAPSWVDPNNKLGNYTASVTNGTLNVTAAPLRGTVWSFTRAYGETNPVFDVTYSGYVNGEGDTILAGPLGLSCVDTNGNPVDTNTQVGVYAITVPAPQSAPNYMVSYVDGSLSITQAVLMVSADPKSRLYGETNPVFTATITGFVNGEDTNVVSGQADLSTTATVASPVGDYEIVPALGTLSATNYSFAFTNGTLTVGKAMLTVTADHKTRTYGAVNPALSATVTGFVDGDTTSVLTGQPALSTLADTNSPIGAYTISTAAGTLTAANYAFTFVDGTLDVTPAPLTITADDQTRVYGGTNPTLSVSYSGFVNGEDPSALIALPTANTTAGLASPVGDYAITLTGGQSTNYNITLIDGALSVTQAVLTATADNQSRAYGANNPTLSISYSGFVNGDDASKLQVPPVVSTTADLLTHVGTYSITLSSGNDQNYRIDTVDGTLTVTQAALTATADSLSRVYGAANPTLNISYSGFRNGENASVLDTQPSIGTTATLTSDVGSYPITLSGGADSDYAITLVDGTLTVTPAPLSVVAADASRVYGAANPIFGGVVSGVVNSDGITATYSTVATTASPVGTYAIVPSWVDPNNKLGNYSASVTNGTLNVTAAPLRGIVWSFTRAYGETNPVFGVTYSGYVNGEGDTILTGPLGLSCVDTNGNPVDTNTQIGVYAITVPAPQSAPNYTVSYVDGSLSITQAVLMVSADAKSRLYGETNPVFAATITGFVNGEDTNVVSGQADLSTTATVASPVGDYEIVAALGSLSATNYSFAFTNGTLTVGKAMLTVTADHKTRTYGAVNPTLSATVAGFVDGDTTNVLSGQPALSTLADTNSPIGAYTISTASGTLTAANYAFTFVDGTLDVTPTLLTITADDQTRVYGETNPVLTVNYSGFVNGEDSNALISLPTARTDATTNSPVGSYNITLSGGQSTNYSITLVNNILVVTPAPLTVTADNQTRAYGDTNPTFSISYSGFVNSENASKLQSTPVATTTADKLSHVGSYPITLSGGSDSNYSITLVDGALTVTQALLTATADDQSRTYGAANPALTITYSGFVNSDDASVLDTPVSPSTSATATSGVGSYPITLSGGVDNDYLVTLVDGTLKVNPATLTITAADVSRPYGATNPMFAGTLVGIQNGDAISATYASLATTNSPAGTYAITPTMVDPSNLSSNYTVGLVDGTLTVTAALQLTATPGFFVVGTDSVNVDEAGKVADGGSLNFAGATLTIRAITNASTQDYVFLDPATNSMVSIDNTNVAFNGVVFGSFSGGDGLNPLVVTFNTNATSVQLTALIDELVFTTTDESANLRQFELTLVYDGITVTGNRTIILDRAPIATDDTFLVEKGVVLNLPFASLLANDSDPDKDTLSIAAVSRMSLEGGIVSKTSTGVIYTPPSPAVDEDSFGYLVTDGRGGYAIGFVTLSCVKPLHLSVHFDSMQQAVLQMVGTAGKTYRVDMSDDLTNWSSLGTVTSDLFGAIKILDLEAKDKPQRFYRAVAE